MINLKFDVGCSRESLYSNIETPEDLVSKLSEKHLEELKKIVYPTLSFESKQEKNEISK